MSETDASPPCAVTEPYPSPRLACPGCAGLSRRVIAALGLPALEPVAKLGRIPAHRQRFPDRTTGLPIPSPLRPILAGKPG